eukprot:2194596-Pyramimonas_sp.AAC.1
MYSTHLTRGLVLSAISHCLWCRSFSWAPRSHRFTLLVMSAASRIIAQLRAMRVSFAPSPAPSSGSPWAGPQLPPYACVEGDTAEA